MKPAIVALLMLMAGQCRADFVGHDISLYDIGGSTYFEVNLLSSGFVWNNPLTNNALVSIDASLYGTQLNIYPAPPIGNMAFGGDASSPPFFTLADNTYSAQIITGVSIDPATTVAGFDISRVSFDDDSVFIVMGGLNILHGQDISIDFQFQGDPTPIVPEPKMIWLLVAAIPIIAWRTKVQSVR